MKLSDITKMFFGDASFTKEKLIGSILAPKLLEGNGQFQLQVKENEIRFGTTEAIAAHFGSPAITHEWDTKRGTIGGAPFGPGKTKANEIPILTFKFDGSRVSEVCAHDSMHTYRAVPLKGRGAITETAPKLWTQSLDEEKVSRIISAFVSRNKAEVSPKVGAKGPAFVAAA